MRKVTVPKRLKPAEGWAKEVKLVLLLILLLSATAEASPGAAWEPAIRYGVTANGYDYMSGGLRNDQRDLMERRSAGYNFKFMVLRARPSTWVPLHLFLANNAAGAIEKVTLTGPWAYFRLPPGTYTILARVGKRTILLRDIIVPEQGRRVLVIRESQP